ncbi:hypothetical protein RB195_008479 [Necator americanus]|uniref:Uncharacterized protein n=1 Tax=Necator americanus TaxID=51031 RepID=A0ABR1CQQ9_NECAM
MVSLGWAGLNYHSGSKVYRSFATDSYIGSTFLAGHFRVMHRSWLILATFFFSLLVVTAFDGTVINFGEALSNLQRSYPKHHFPVVRAQRFYYPIAEVNRY